MRGYGVFLKVKEGGRVLPFWWESASVGLGSVGALPFSRSERKGQSLSAQKCIRCWEQQVFERALRDSDCTCQV